MSSLAHARPIAYRRRATPLHAARAPVAAAYGAALAACALLLSHPLLLGALLLAVVGAAAGAGVLGPVARTARAVSVPLVILTVLVNVLVTRSGLTVFMRLGDWGALGQVNLTAEAAAYGAVLALRILVVTLACLLIVCCADPDELLASFRRVSPRSALTAVLATRLLPVLLEDSRRLADAQRCRAGGAESGLRAKLAILRAAVSGAIERSLDVAAVLEMRGYGARSPPPVARGPRSRHDIAFAASAAGVLALVLFADARNLAPFHPYPLLSAPVGTGALAIALALLAVALAPFAARRGTMR